MERNPVKFDGSTTTPRRRHVKSQIILRLLAAAFTLVAALIMAINKQVLDFGAGLLVHSDYKSSPAFGFFLIGNAIACAYALVSLVSVTMLLNGKKAYVVYLLDLVATELVMASASTATAIAYVAKNGNEKVGWSELCSYVNRYCNLGGVSLVFSFLGFAFFFLVCALSPIHSSPKPTGTGNSTLRANP